MTARNLTALADEIHFYDVDDIDSGTLFEWARRLRDAVLSEPAAEESFEQQVNAAAYALSRQSH